MVETRWSLPGIHGGELKARAATGKSVYVDGQLLSRIVDGKFVEEWVHWDTVGLLRQIGAVPHPHRDQLVSPSGELDLAVRDLRDPVFGHHRPDLPAGEAGLGRPRPWNAQATAPPTCCGLPAPRSGACAAAQAVADAAAKAAAPRPSRAQSRLPESRTGRPRSRRLWSRSRPCPGW